MSEQVVLESERIILRKLQPSEVNNIYLSWLTDVDVNEFLEVRFQQFTLEDLSNYVKKLLETSHEFLFGIFLKNSNRHIGNIKIGPIIKPHDFAELGLLIGEKDCWGKGFATEAIKILSYYAFDQLKLNKLIAGCYEPNLGSIKAFQKAGFVVEGIYKKHFLYNGSYVDAVRLSLFQGSTPCKN